MAKKLTQEEFIERCVAVHGDKYDYTKTVYINKRSDITVICKLHKEFIQKAESHSDGYEGCPECKRIQKAAAGELGRATKISKAKCKLEKFVDDNNLVLLSEYVAAKSSILAECVVCKKSTVTTPDSILRKGLPRCQLCVTQAKHRRYIELPTKLYYFKIDNVYKIGITTKTLKQRYSVDYERIADVITWEFPNGYEALAYEQSIIAKYSKYRYKGETPFKDGTGTTECFTEDIYKLYKEQLNE
jgi:hypothetical protein